MSMGDNRSDEYIATVDDMMQAAILAYAGSASDGQPRELPSIQEALSVMFAEFGQDRTAAALGEPRQTLRRWHKNGALKGEAGRARQDIVRRAAAKIQAKREAVSKLAACKAVTIEFELVYSNTDEDREVTFDLDPHATPKDCLDSSRLAGLRSTGSPHNPFAAVAGRYAVGGTDLFAPLLRAMEPESEGGFYGEVFAQSGTDRYASITAITFH